MSVFQGPSTSVVDSLPFLFLVVRHLSKTFDGKKGEKSQKVESYLKFSTTESFSVHVRYMT